MKEEKKSKNAKAVINQEIGLRIRSIREHMRKSQDDVATELGIGLLAYGSKERGQRPWFAHELVKVATILGTDVSYLTQGGTRNARQILVSEATAVLRGVDEKIELVKKMFEEVETKEVRDIPTWADELSYEDRIALEQYLDIFQRMKNVGKYGNDD